ncbi:HEPN domain-containing protein [Thalassolituus marinus]|uniref:Apea-like HEPN domain-containing protein n=1 Tax=Thalassolituus marinus TaxID=671053 RepID=A0ABS7ZXN9_9GAMM|nr:HEPN domain-containing protein [Thalassolituus marinus]MCA6065370.1 hypothetical protein [Thalassolituus marinus]
MMSYAELKQRHRNEREDFHENLSLRVHRALSWLQRAEDSEDADAQFIFLWIAFNAAYATDISKGTPERDTFIQFLKKLDALDNTRLLESITWNEFSGSIRILLNNRYVFPAFWDYQKGQLTEQQWQEQFASANWAAQVALGGRDTVTVLSIVLSRIYTLRNQIVHGGATWNSSVNRDQMRDCVAFLSKLVPAIVTIMMDHPETLWGDASFPVVRD